MYKKNDLYEVFHHSLDPLLLCCLSRKVENQVTFNIQKRKYEFYEKIGPSSLRGSLIERIENV